jgi:hypothetical protein
MSKTDTPIQFDSKTKISIKYFLNTQTQKLLLFTLTILHLLNVNTIAQQPDCALVCAGKLNVSLDANCQATITAGTVLQNLWDPMCAPNGPQAFQVFVMLNGDVIPTSPVVTGDYIGKTLQVKVKHWKTGNTCWTDIFIEDKMPPVLKCPANVTISCSAPSDPSKTGQATATDCSGYTISYTDVVANYNCNNPAGKITRTWLATDGNGFKSTCSQIITIKKTGVNDVVFPKNLDGIQKPALDCKNPNIDPTNTGFPTIDDYPVNNATCMVSGTYSDQLINICTGTRKILRTWTLVDWCTGQIKSQIQIIKIEDKTGPVISCQQNLIGNSYSDQCKGSVIIPAASISDDCSGYSVQIIGSWGGSLKTNGGVMHDIPIGTHTITFYATDDCGNSSQCTSILKLKDNSPPVVVCNGKLIISIGGNGKAIVNAKTFDDGSTDNCCIDKYLVKRMSEPDSLFNKTISFNCDEAGKTVLVILKVIDCSGNENTCMVQADIQDKLPPTILCPPDVTTTCPVDLTNLAQFGIPTASDNCGNITIKETNNVQLTSCGTGLIKRIFTVTGSDGKTSECTQIVEVKSSNPFSLNDITWPKDYEAQGCTSINDLEPEDLPAPYDKPIFNNNSCSFAGVSHSDEVFDIAAPACFKILRKWVVLDWCQYNPNIPNSPGRWEHTQVIKVFDYEKPKLNCPTDVTVSSTTTDCSGAQVNLPPLTATDCNPKFTVKNSFNSGGADASGFYPLGTTLVTYTVTDGCKNTATCTVKVTIKDGKKPTPNCLNGLSVTIMPSTLSVTIWAKDFVSKVLDDCTLESKIQYRIRKSPSGNQGPPTDQSITFTCDDLGTQAVDVWVGDEAGNWDYCQTFIEVQDNMKSCPPNLNGNIIMAGTVKDEAGKTLENVNLTVNSNQPKSMTTDNNGAFLFSGLKKGQDYIISPEKDTNPTNGITTIDLLTIQKHILGIKQLGSPYKVIAADVDKNGYVSTKDLFELRKLILQLIDKFPNNKSWRFIDGNYVFPDPKNPFLSVFPEVLNYNKVNNDMLNLNVMGIKVGDVDGSAIPNQIIENEVRSELPELQLSLTDQKLIENTEIEVPVFLNQTNIQTLQFTLKFDETKLELINISSKTLPDWSADAINDSRANEGIIAMAWYSLIPFVVDQNTVAFTMRFKVKESGILSQSCKITRDLIEPMAYSESEQTLTPKLRYSDNNIKKTLMNHHNSPNPFHSETSINYYISYNSDITLNIYDINGKLILSKQTFAETGLNQILLRATDLKHSGLFIYEIVTPWERVSDKMIITD